MGGAPLPHGVCLTAAPLLGDGKEPSQASTLQVAMVTLLLSLRKRMDFSFSPNHLPGLPPFYTLWEPDCPAPLSPPSTFCHRGQLVERLGFKSQSSVKATACSGLKGKQEGKAQEMGPHLGLVHSGSFSLHLLPAPPLPRPLPLQLMALPLGVGSIPLGLSFLIVTETAWPLVVSTPGQYRDSLGRF